MKNNYITACIEDKGLNGASYHINKVIRIFKTGDDSNLVGSVGVDNNVNCPELRK